MTQHKNVRLMLAGIAALILISVAVACQPTAEVEDTPALPFATPAAETDTQQEPSTAPAVEADSPQPPPATQAPAAADPTLPDVTLPLPSSKIPEPLQTGPAQMPHRDEIGLSPEAEKVIVLTQKDLAQRLSVAEEVILIQSIEPVTWPDASLGCPQPGMAYAQVLTPGFRVIVEAGGEVYEYHTGPAESMILCEVQEPLQRPGPEPSKRPPILREEMVTTPVGKDLDTLIDVAKQDLARRLDVAPVVIEVLQIERAEWPDTSLGCGEPGLARLPVAIAGYRLVLLAKDREYVYHTGRERGVVFCPKG